MTKTRVFVDKHTCLVSYTIDKINFWALPSSLLEDCHQKRWNERHQIAVSTDLWCWNCREQAMPWKWLLRRMSLSFASESCHENDCSNLLTHDYVEPRSVNRSLACMSLNDCKTCSVARCVSHDCALLPLTTRGKRSRVLWALQAWHQIDRLAVELVTACIAHVTVWMGPFRVPSCFTLAVQAAWNGIHHHRNGIHRRCGRMAMNWR